MKTTYVKADKNSIVSIAKEAANIIRKGGLVAFPTETVYGLGGDGLNDRSCEKIYKAKGRPSDNPLILHISSLDMLKAIALDIPEKGRRLIEDFWPGPLTLIFNKSSIVPYSVTGGLNTVAVRFPSNLIARELITRSNLPIAAPSANTSGRPSPTEAWHVLEDLDGKIDMIIDGGPCEVGLESTIVDVTGNTPTLLRPGGISIEALRLSVGEIDIDPSIMGALEEGKAPKAPGMKYKHYSPRARVILVKGKDEAVVPEINRLILENTKNGLKTGVFSRHKTADLYKNAYVLDGGESLAQIGSNLFNSLRKFDLENIDIIYSEAFDLGYEGLAIMNRLYKASGFSIIEV